jgi:preprotein translocase subunit YajC
MWNELAHAQSGAPAGGAPAFVQFIPFVIILGLAYLLLIRPQRQQERQHRTMLDNLKRNDEVTTAGGLYGRIVSLTESVVTLEVAPNVNVRVERSQIKNQVKPAVADDKERRRDKEKEKGRG